MPNGDFAQDATVTVKNDATGESAEMRTDANGRFAYDISELPSGYNENNLVKVDAKKGELKGKNETTVVISQYRIGPYRDDLNILLRAPDETNEINWTLVIGIIVIVIIVIAILAMKSKKSKSPSETREEKKVEKDSEEEE